MVHQGVGEVEEAHERPKQDMRFGYLSLGFAGGEEVCRPGAREAIFAFSLPSPHVWFLLEFRSFFLVKPPMRWLGVVVLILVAATAASAQPLLARRALAEWISDLDDKDALVREEALEVLAQLGPAAKDSVPKLERMLKDELPTCREKAAHALWKVAGRKEPAVTMFTSAAKAGNGARRIQAVQKLRELGVPAADVLPVLFDLLGDADALAQGQVYNQLREIGTDAVLALAAALPKSSAVKREQLLTAAAVLTPTSRPLIPVLQGMLADASAADRLVIVRTLRTIDPNNPNIRTQLIELARSSEVGVRRDALTLAFNIEGARELEPTFRAALKETDPALRAKAAQALFDLDAKHLNEVLPVLVAVVKEPGGLDGLNAAAAAMQRIGPEGKSAIPALVAALKRPEMQGYHFVVANALARMGPDAVPAVLPWLKDKDVSLRNAAQTVLQNASSEAAPHLLPLLEGTDRQSIFMVLSWVTRHGPAAAATTPALVKLLRGDDQIIRQQAITALGRIGPAAKEAVPALLEKLDAEMTPLHQRTLVMTLGQIGPDAKAAAPKLTAMLKVEPASLRFNVAEALARIDKGNKDAGATMLELLREPPAARDVQPAELFAALAHHGVKAKSVVEATRACLEKTKTPAIRLINVRAFAQHFGPAAESASLLNELLKEEQPQIRHEAALALARHGEAGKEAVPVLLQMWKGPGSTDAPRALNALAELGPAASPAAEPLLSAWKASADIAERVRLADVLLAIDAAKGKPALDWLREQIADGSFTNYAAALVLCQRDAANPKLLDALLKTVEHEDQPRALAAIDGLGKLGPHGKAALEKLRVIRAGDDPTKRVKAALAVWRIDGDAKAALPVLLAVVEHIPTVITAPGQNLAVIHAFDALGQMGPAAKPAAPKMRQIAAQGAGWSFQATNALNKIEPHTQPSSQPGLPPG